MHEKTALIVGAGVGGMAAAWQLQSIGWTPIVIEKAAKLRKDGYMLGLSGPGYEIACECGLMAALRKRHRPIHENVYHAQDGRELWRAKYSELLGHEDWITLSRTDLVEVLYDALPDGMELRFGTVLNDLTETGDRITATLSDGSSIDAALVIAADGMRSAVRRKYFGPDEAYLQPLGYRFAAFQMKDDLGLGHDFLSFAEPGRLTEFYTLSDGQLATLYAWKSDDQSNIAPERRRAVLREAFEDAHPTARHYIEALPSDDALYFDNLEMIEMPSWSKGRLLLLGDSAHCLTLVSGQGAGMAITSAKILADELAAYPVKQALENHDRRMRPAITQLQNRSRKIAPLFIPSTPRAFAIRNFIMRHAPKRLLGWYLSRSIRTERISAALALEPLKGKKT